MNVAGIRMAIASSGLGHVTRGIETWAAELARALAERGEDVVLFKGGGRVGAAFERVIPCWQREQARTGRLLRWLPKPLGWRLGVGSAYGVEQTTFALRLLKHLRRESVDILHVQDPQLALIVQRARQLGWVRTRTILAHGTEEPSTFLRKIAYLQHLAPSHEQECLVAGAGNPSWTTIPNFVDTRRFSPGRNDALRSELGIPADALVVLTVAAIKRKHKRIDYLLEEFARMRAAEQTLPVWLVVAGGRESETDKLIALGHQMLGDRVRFLVRFPRERMAELYRSADVFVLSSLKEMMPIAVLEATASGLPCVVNRHPVLEWMVGPGGETTDMTAAGALAAILRALLIDTGRSRRLGQLARRHCLQHFGEEAVVEQILKYYQAVLGHDSRADIERPERVRCFPSGPGASSVSVVIPAFNSGQWIEQAIDSVLSQSVPPMEILVVDDGSTDDTVARVARYGERVTCVSQPNRGVAAARNRGLRKARGEMIALLDADDVWHPRKLEGQISVLHANPRIGLLGTRIFQWPGVLPEVDCSRVASVADVAREHLAVKNQFVTSSVVLRRQLVERVGEFDVQLHGPEDHDYWLRAAEVSDTANLDLPLTGYRSVAGSLSKNALAMERGMRQILSKLDTRDAWKGSRFLRRRAYSYFHFSCAYMHGAAGNQRAAVLRMLRSFAWYPLPYRRSEEDVMLARPRRLAVLILRLLRLMPLDRSTS